MKPVETSAGRGVWRGVRLPSVALTLVLAFGAASGPALATEDRAAHRDEGSAAAPGTGRDAEATPSLNPPLFSERDARSIGSISVGHPHAGLLVNAVRMPAGKEWVLSVPDHAYGTEETVRNLMHCIRRVHEQFPDTPPVVIGSISAERGGHVPPHKSHRTGRDADVYLYRTGKVRWYERATAADLDRPRTWALLRAVITETDVEFVLLDRSVQKLLEEYALSIGEEPGWITSIFHGGRTRYELPLVKHVPGHTAHMHIRFVSAAARERGRLAYDRLVEQGHIELPGEERRHTVVAGDTLIGIARVHGTTVENIQRLNDLDSTVIRVGQVLRVHARQDIRGARDPIVVPPRRLPQDPGRARDVATLAALAEVEATLGRELAEVEAER